MALVYMMLLAGAAVASCSPININSALEEVHKSIATPLNLADHEVGSHPLFRSVIRSLNNSCQVDVMLMNATLDVYMRIFNSSQPLMESVPSEALEKLRRHANELKSHLSRLQQKKEHLLSKIHDIEVDDPLVQRKALAEFLEVYHAASCLLHSRDKGCAQ